MKHPASCTKDDMEERLFPLPPLAEQRRIVAKVESLFAQTRALEAKLRQAQADIVTVNRAALNRLSVAADDDTFAAAWTTVATPSTCSTTTRATSRSCARRSSSWRCRASSCRRTRPMSRRASC